MPPRLTTKSFCQAFEGLSLKDRPTNPSRSHPPPALSSSQSQFSTSSRCLASQRQQREYGDPWAIAQAKKRKAANLARQAVLKREREASIGNPVRGITTPFVQSFDTVIDPASSPDKNASPTEQSQLNFFLSKEEYDTAVDGTRDFTEPLPNPNRSAADPQEEAEKLEEHQLRDENARLALSRIIDLKNGSNKDQTRVNIQRCIEKFGRHRTDEFLPPKPATPLRPLVAASVEQTPRSGPDTGSPEVQAAILTAKIRVLANHLEGAGRQDKVNKRNLRLLVHRRQKMLKYLRRKERGGPRWQHLVETLGLTDGTWKGEITM